jgi:hypothetical protein
MDQRIPPTPLGRDRVCRSVDAVKAALAAAEVDDQWVNRVNATLGVLASDLRGQVTTAQSQAGLPSRVLAAEPRLSHAVGAHVREQIQIAEQADDLVAGMRASTGADVARGRVWHLVARVALHRQGGSDLLHEAEQADIGGES